VGAGCLGTTGISVEPAVTRADAQAFAEKMGVLCNDVFAAA
jgi:hypothetical protein